jgi:XisH protein
MSKDLYHNQVKTALQKDGWKITHDPYEIRVGGVEMYVDLAAEQLIAAQRDTTKIAIEIKSFLNPSTISDFHLAHGQFLDYRYALDLEEPDRILYLAVPLRTYQTFFTLKFIEQVRQRSQIKLVVYDIEQENIVQWIE